MDDIYFTDKKGHRNGKENKPSKERFSQSSYKDIDADPSLKKREKTQQIPPQRKTFSVNIPEDDFNRRTAVDRTPQGRRRSDISSPPPSRTPVGERVRNDVPLHYNPTARQQPNPPASREPKSRPVAPVRKKKSGVGGKIAVALFMIVFAVIIALFGYGYSVLGEIDYDNTIKENAYVNKGDLMSSSSVTNILFIGSDARDYDGTEGQRSDSMILFSIDKKNRQIKLTSFLRDSYVYIPEVDYSDKLNASFSYGGPQLTMDTIEYNFGVDIDHYIIINFEIFTQLIDLMGGITIDGVTENEVYYMTNSLSFPNIKEGTNTLNGYKALWYCRMRMLDDDFHRTERQRKVINALVKQAASTNLFDLIDIVKQVVPNISTDIPQSKLLSLGAGAALSFMRYDIVQQQIPADDTWKYGDVDGSSVILINLDANKQALRNFIFNKYDENATTTLDFDENEFYGEDYGYYDEDDEDYEDYYDYY